VERIPRNTVRICWQLGVLGALLLLTSLAAAQTCPDGTPPGCPPDWQVDPTSNTCFRVFPPALYDMSGKTPTDAWLFSWQVAPHYNNGITKSTVRFDYLNGGCFASDTRDAISLAPQLGHPGQNYQLTQCETGAPSDRCRQGTVINNLGENCSAKKIGNWTPSGQGTCNKRATILATVIGVPKGCLPTMSTTVIVTLPPEVGSTCYGRLSTCSKDGQCCSKSCTQGQCGPLDPPKPAPDMGSQMGAFSCQGSSDGMDCQAELGNDTACIAANGGIWCPAIRSGCSCTCSLGACPNAAPGRSPGAGAKKDKAPSAKPHKH
jgi:hypothetical protein